MKFLRPPFDRRGQQEMFTVARALMICISIVGMGLSQSTFSQTIPVSASLISKAPPSDTGDGTSEGRIANSADGRFVAIVSTARNLIPGQIDEGVETDLFLKDRTSGETILVSHAFDSAKASTGISSFSGSNSHEVDLSADGRFVLFRSRAGNLVDGFTGGAGAEALFLFDRMDGQVMLVSRAMNSANTAASGLDFTARVTENGRYVLYASTAPNIVPGVKDTNGVEDVFVFDRTTGAVQLISHAVGQPDIASGGFAHEISDDGRLVLLTSSATDLVAGVTDTNQAYDTFLFDRTLGTMTLVSRAASDAAKTGNGNAIGVALSKSGSRVLYSSWGDDHVAGLTDSNGGQDLFLFDLESGSTALVSRAQGSTTTTANQAVDAQYARLLDDSGRFALFGSTATNLVVGQNDTNGQIDAFLFDSESGETTLASRTSASATTAPNAGGYPYGLSSNGQRVLFVTYATDVLGNVVDENVRLDSFVYDAADMTTTLVSRSLEDPKRTLNYGGFGRYMLADGSAVLFRSFDSKAVANVDDNNGWRDAFRFDMNTGLTSLLSDSKSRYPTGLSGQSEIAAISDDRRHILFGSDAINAAPSVWQRFGGTNYYLRDRVSGATSLITRSALSPTQTGAGSTQDIRMSGNANRFAFDSGAKDLVEGMVDTRTAPDIFLHDRTTGTTRLVSHHGDSPLTAGNSASSVIDMDGSGRFVLFRSSATDLIAGAVSSPGVFLYDAQSNASILVSSAPGSPTTGASGGSVGFELSEDGGSTLLMTRAPDFVNGLEDSNSDYDIFVVDRLTGARQLISHAADLPLTTGNAGSNSAGFSDDGNIVVFTSNASNLVTGGVDDNQSQDVFVQDRTTGETILVSRSAAQSLTAANGFASQSLLSSNGRRVVFKTSATDMVGGSPGVFLFDRITGQLRNIATDASPVAISANGERIVLNYPVSNPFNSSDGNLSDDVVLYDAVSGTSVLVSRTLADASVTGNYSSHATGLSRDGSVVKFDSTATNLDDARHFHFIPDAFIAVIPADYLFIDSFE